MWRAFNKGGSKPGPSAKEDDSFVTQISTAVAKAKSFSVATMIEGLEQLHELCGVLDAKVKVINAPGAVDVLISTMRSGPSEALKRYALGCLISLSFGSPEAKVRMYESPGLMPALLLTAQDGETLDTKEFALHVIWNLSDIRSIADDLVCKCDILTWLKDVDKNLDTKVAIIYLNLAVTPRARAILVQDEPSLDALNSIIKRKTQDYAVFYSTLALAILKGSDQTYLQLSSQDLRTILEVLEGALSNKRVQGNHWPLHHPLVGLRYLTTVDRNRELLGTDWLPKLGLAIIKALKDSDPYSVEMALSCLAQYALDDKTIAAVKTNVTFLKAAKSVLDAKKEDEELAGAINAASGLIFTLEGREKERNATTTKAMKGQVMISYAWGPPPHQNKALATDMEDYLIQSGFSVWRDEIRMRADIMQAMADAIESSESVIVLVNKNYMESANCKRELNFALNKQRKIVPLVVQAGYDHRTDGWLGVAIGELLFYDISSPVKRLKEFEKMVKNELGKGAGEIPAKLTRAPSSKSTVAVKVPETADELMEWAAKSGVSEDIARALVREGFVEGDLLRDLSAQTPSEIRLLLGIEQAAQAVRLRMALLKLFPE